MRRPASRRLSAPAGPRTTEGLPGLSGGRRGDVFEGGPGLSVFSGTRPARGSRGGGRPSRRGPSPRREEGRGRAESCVPSGVLGPTRPPSKPPHAGDARGLQTQVQGPVHAGRHPRGRGPLEGRGLGLRTRTGHPQGQAQASGHGSAGASLSGVLRGNGPAGHPLYPQGW